MKKLKLKGDDTQQDNIAKTINAKGFDVAVISIPIIIGSPQILANCLVQFEK